MAENDVPDRATPMAYEELTSGMEEILRKIARLNTSCLCFEKESGIGSYLIQKLKQVYIKINKENYRGKLFATLLLLFYFIKLYNYFFKKQFEPEILDVTKGPVYGALDRLLVLLGPMSLVESDLISYAVAIKLCFSFQIIYLFFFLIWWIFECLLEKRIKILRRILVFVLSIYFYIAYLHILEVYLSSFKCTLNSSSPARILSSTASTTTSTTNTTSTASNNIIATNSAHFTLNKTVIICDIDEYFRYQTMGVIGIIINFLIGLNSYLFMNQTFPPKRHRTDILSRVDSSYEVKMFIYVNICASISIFQDDLSLMAIFIFQIISFGFYSFSWYYFYKYYPYFSSFTNKMYMSFFAIMIIRGILRIIEIILLFGNFYTSRFEFYTVILISPILIKASLNYANKKENNLMNCPVEEIASTKEFLWRIENLRWLLKKNMKHNVPTFIFDKLVLLGVGSNHISGCQDSECFCKEYFMVNSPTKTEGKKKYEENQKGFLTKLLRKELKIGLEIFESNSIVEMANCFYYLEELPTIMLAYQHFAKVKKGHSLTFEQSLFLWILEKKIKKRLKMEYLVDKRKVQENLDFIDLENVFTYENLERFLFNTVQESTKQTLLFWKELSNQQPSMKKITEYGGKINEFFKKVEKVDKVMNDFLVKYDYKIVTPLIILGSFYYYIGNDPKKGTDVLKKSFEIEKEKNLGLKDIHSMSIRQLFSERMLFDQSVGVIRVSAEEHNLGEIIEISNNIQKLFEKKAAYLKGKKVDLLMPNCYAHYHNQFMRRFKETGISKFQKQININLYGKCSNSNAFQLALFVNLSPTIEKGLNFIGALKKKQRDIGCHVLTYTDGTVDCMTEAARSLLDISENKSLHRVKIFRLCPQLQEVFKICNYFLYENNEIDKEIVQRTGKKMYSNKDATDCFDMEEHEKLQTLYNQYKSSGIDLTFHVPQNFTNNENVSNNQTLNTLADLSRTHVSLATSDYFGGTNVQEIHLKCVVQDQVYNRSVVIRVLELSRPSHMTTQDLKSESVSLSNKNSSQNNDAGNQNLNPGAVFIPEQVIEEEEDESKTKNLYSALVGTETVLDKHDAEQDYQEINILRRFNPITPGQSTPNSLSVSSEKLFKKVQSLNEKSPTPIVYENIEEEMKTDDAVNTKRSSKGAKSDIAAAEDKKLESIPVSPITANNQLKALNLNSSKVSFNHSNSEVQVSENLIPQRSINNNDIKETAFNNQVSKTDSKDETEEQEKSKAVLNIMKEDINKRANVLGDEGASSGEHSSIRSGILKKIKIYKNIVKERRLSNNLNFLRFYIILFFILNIVLSSVNFQISSIVFYNIESYDSVLVDTDLIVENSLEIMIDTRLLYLDLKGVIGSDYFSKYGIENSTTQMIEDLIEKSIELRIYINNYVTDFSLSSKPSLRVDKIQILKRNSFGEKELQTISTYKAMIEMISQVDLITNSLKENISDVPVDLGFEYLTDNVPNAIFLTLIDISTRLKYALHDGIANNLKNLLIIFIMLILVNCWFYFTLIIMVFKNRKVLETIVALLVTISSRDIDEIIKKLERFQRIIYSQNYYNLFNVESLKSKTMSIASKTMKNINVKQSSGSTSFRKRRIYKTPNFYGFHKNFFIFILVFSLAIFPYFIFYIIEYDTNYRFILTQQIILDKMGTCSDQKFQQLESILEIQEIFATQSQGKIKNSDIDVVFEQTLLQNAVIKNIWDKYINSNDDVYFSVLMSGDMCSVIGSDCDNYKETAGMGIVTLIAKLEANYKLMYWKYLEAGRTYDVAKEILNSQTFLETKNLQANVDNALSWLLEKEMVHLVDNTETMISSFGVFISIFVIIFCFSVLFIYLGIFSHLRHTYFEYRNLLALIPFDVVLRSKILLNYFQKTVKDSTKRNIFNI